MRHGDGVEEWRDPFWKSGRLYEGDCILPFFQVVEGKIAGSALLSQIFAKIWCTQDRYIEIRHV